MSIHAVVIGLALAGQVGSADEWYPSSGGEAEAGREADGRGDAAGVVQLLEPPPSENGEAADSSSPLGGSNDPYGSPNQPAGSRTRSDPRDKTNSPPATGQSAPPAFRDAQAPGDSPSDLTASRQATKGLKPTAMMRDMLTPPRGSQLSGNAVPLVEVLSGAASRTEQTQRVEAYWDLCSSVTDYYLGLREQEELRRLRSSAARSGTAWQQAEAEMAVRLDTSLRAARACQLRIAGWLGGGAGSLPLPADAPHCGSYHSRYEEIFASRPSTEAQELAALLPLRYAELKDAAAQVTRAEEFLAAVARNDKPDGMGTLRALEFLALRRRAFVQIARDYNRRIARYTELAMPGEIGAERLIGMLIKTEHTSTATRPSSATGRQSSSTSGVPPRTFADGQSWEPAGNRADGAQRDEAVRPTSGTLPQGPRQERSLLVSPR